MFSDNFAPRFQARESDENGGQKIAVSDSVNGAQHFVVEIQRRSHRTGDETNANSRITDLHRGLSRIGSGRGSEKRIYPTFTHRKRPLSVQTSECSGNGFYFRFVFFDNDVVVKTAATLRGVSIPEKPLITSNPHVHQQITFKNCSLNSTSSKCKSGGKNFNVHLSSPSLLSISPRRILFFFSNLSCIGTILLIYFMLSMDKLKLNTDDSDFN